MRRISLTFGLAAAALGLLTASAGAQVSLVPFGGGSFAVPYHVAGEPGDGSRVYVVEAAGTVRLVEDGVTQTTPFLDISADVFGVGSCECGLFSIAFPPDYASSGLFYVFYTRDVPDPDNHELVLEEFQRDPGGDTAGVASRREVMVIPHLTASNHNGGQLQFGPDGLLYISVGDGGNTPQNGQSVTTRLGKILRVDPAGDEALEYAIPADNPFADGGGSNADEIYSYGLRNPWRFSFDRLTGDLSIGDVGAGSWEEIDFREEGNGRGANFGWRCFEGDHVFVTSAECSPAPANHVPPVFEYQNPPVGAAAVVGGYVVRDGALPSLLGRYVFADTFAALGGELWAVDLHESGAVNAAGLGLAASNVVSFGEDACAHLYVATLGGTVYRLEPASGPFPCDPQSPAEPPTSLGLVAGLQQVKGKLRSAASRARARWKRGKHRRPRVRRGRARARR